MPTRVCTHKRYHVHPWICTSDYIRGVFNVHKPLTILKLCFLGGLWYKHGIQISSSENCCSLRSTCFPSVLTLLFLVIYMAGTTEAAGGSKRGEACRGLFSHTSVMLISRIAVHTDTVLRTRWATSVIYSWFSGNSICFIKPILL